MWDTNDDPNVIDAPAEVFQARQLPNYAQINRDDSGLLGSFVILDGQGPANWLAERITTKKTKRPVHILDLGISTGQQMVSLLSDQSDRTNRAWSHGAVDLEDVYPVVRSEQDFSNAARSLRTRRAFTRGYVHYEVVEVDDYPCADTYDLIVSFDGFGLTEEPADLLYRLFSSLRKGGVLYTNVFPQQRDETLAAASDIGAQAGSITTFYDHRYPPQDWDVSKGLPTSFRLAKPKHR